MEHLFAALARSLHCINYLALLAIVSVELDEIIR